MGQGNAKPHGSRKRSSDRRIEGSARLPAALLAAGLILGAVAQDARAQGRPEIPFSQVSIILETNATDCDTGLQLFFDGDAWKKVKVEDPNGRTVLDVRAKGTLARFGVTEQFNETSEPVMAELVEGLDFDCDEPEFTLAELFELFPEGDYEFEGETVEGEWLAGEATLSHVIPAPPDIVAPEEGAEVDPDDTVIMWNRVDEPILPGLGRGPSDEVEIVGFHVVVDREDPNPLVVFTADLPAGATEVTVPPEFLQAGATYKFEILQIDVSGNQTIAESEFETAD